LRTLVDSGAARCLLRRSAFLSLCSSYSRMPFLNPTCPLYSANGGSIKVVGEAELQLEGGPPWTWIIVDGIAHDALLGADLMQATQTSLDWASNLLIMGPTSYPFCYDSQLEIEEVGIEFPLDRLLQEFDHVFYKQGTPLPMCILAPLVIDTGRSAPVFQRPYRTPLSRRPAVEIEIQNLLDLDIIEHSTSPYSAPLLLVPKKDQTLRCVVDYRRLNLVTKMDRHPLPLIQDIFDQLGGATIFSTLDLKQGYHQLPIHPQSREKTAFSCHLGLFQFKRASMGLACMPPFFQRQMQRCLAGLVGICCLVYLDDIIIYSPTPTDHVKHVRLVLERIERAGLTLKREKCHFGARAVELLGYVVCSQGIKANPDKVQAISTMPPPTNAKGVRRFLGMCGYYRQTIEHYAHVAEPLVQLTHKRTRFHWGTDQQEAFDKLKTHLISSPIMAYPRTDLPYRVYCDASDTCVGSVLVQEDELGVERVIHYVSHQLSTVEQRWATIEKEAYAIIYALQKLRPYLYGADFSIHTDHKPLKSLLSSPMKNPKLQRWGMIITEYAPRIYYHDGPSNTRADMLSRLDSGPEVATLDTEDWTNAAFPDGLEACQIPFATDELDGEAVKRAQREHLAELFVTAQDPDSEYEVHDELLYSTRQPTRFDAEYPRLVLPPPFRTPIINRVHREVGHLGAMKTLRRVTEAYVWPGMDTEVRRTVRACPTCTVHISRRTRVPMGEMPLPQYPGQFVSADLMGPLVESNQGCKYILCILDHASGWVEAYPIPNKKAATVVDKFTTEYFPRAGYPEVILTDCGTEFLEREWEEFLAKMGIEHRQTTVRHPQSNGKVERMNRTIKETLRKLVNGQRTTWQEKLPAALTAVRTSPSASTGHSPFFVYHARRPRLPLSTLLHPDCDGERLLGDRLATLSETLKEARLMTTLSRARNKARIDEKANDHDIQIGDSVIVVANEPLSLTAKWDPQYEVYRIRGTTFWLRHQQSGKEIRVHKEKLRLVDPHLSWDDVSTRPRRQTHLRRQPAPRPVADPPPVVNRPPAGRPPPLDGPQRDVPGRPSKRQRTEEPTPLAPPGDAHIIAPRVPVLPPVVAQATPNAASHQGAGTNPPQLAQRAMDTQRAPAYRPYNLRVRKRHSPGDLPPTEIYCNPEEAKRARIESVAFTSKFLLLLNSPPRDEPRTTADYVYMETPADYVYLDDTPAQTVRGRREIHHPSPWPGL